MRVSEGSAIALAALFFCLGKPVAADVSRGEETVAPDRVCEEAIEAARTPCRIWTVDYEVRSMFDSNTRYQFGTPPSATPAYAPLSLLDWSLNSVWTGLRFGVEQPNWNVSFEWLTPMEKNIHGSIADLDWEATHFDNLSYSSERWNDGQMLDLKGAFKLTDMFFTLPIEVWPVAGFRFQRFDITSHDTRNVFPTSYPIPGDVGTFNQQYYMSYVGGELRTTLEIAAIRRSISLAFQGDWGATWGYNIDHHISGYEPTTHRYTMESTSGGAVHLALIAEMPLNQRWSFGVQGDYLTIFTTGTHRWLMYGAKSADETWSNGVKVESDQSSITAFLRAKF